MFPIAFITFRESLEMLLIGVAVYTALVEHNIPKKRELLSGFGMGFVLSAVLFVISLFARWRIGFEVHEMGELAEGISYLITGFFLFFTAILLHRKVKNDLKLSSSYLLSSSVYAIGFLAVLREGLEIVFFSLSTSMISNLTSSLLGFLLGVVAAGVVGFVGSKFAGKAISHAKLLWISEVGIKLLSIYFVVKGLAELSEFFIS